MSKPYRIKIEDSEGLTHTQTIENKDDLNVLKSILIRIEKLATKSTEPIPKTT